jgi:uncharacterized membrane protein
MDSALLLVALWLAFAATHMGMSSLGLRPRLVGVLGERGFQGVYSLLALAIFVPLVGVYFANKHAGPHLWFLGGVPGLRHAIYLGMALCFVLIAGGLARPSPASLNAGRPEVRGALRVTRHPVFMATGLFGLLHLCVVSVHASELAFFGGFPLFALIGSHHQDVRKLASGTPEFRSFHAETSLLPNLARIPAALRDDPLPALIGVGITVALRIFHPTLFGP